MTPESRRHQIYAAAFTQAVEGTSDWDAPTPVAEWRANDIVEHLLAWLPGFLHGLGGPQLGQDGTGSLVERWHTRTREVQDLLENTGTSARPVALGPFAGQTIGQVIDQAYTADIFMHTWDLAQAAGVAIALDPDYAHALHEDLARHEQILRNSGHYGPAVPTTSPDPVLRLMAFIGRDPQWRNHDATAADGGAANPPTMP